MRFSFSLPLPSLHAHREYYRPHELTSLDDLYCSNMINSMRDYTPSFAKNISPFAVRDPQEKNAAASASPDQPGFPSSSLKVQTTGLPASTGTMNQRPGESVDDGRYICTDGVDLFWRGGRGRGGLI